MSVQQIIEKYNSIPYPKKPSKPELVLKEKDYAKKADYLRALADKTDQYEDEMADYRSKREDYSKQQSAVLDEFQTVVIDEAGLSGLPKHIQDQAYSLAWQEGHSSGLNDVLNSMLNFSDLVENAYQAGYHNGLNESKS